MNVFEINVADLRRSRASERDIELSATVDWALELSAVEPAGSRPSSSDSGSSISSNSNPISSGDSNPISSGDSNPISSGNLKAALTLSPIAGGLLVHGVADFVARHSCHRCLREWTEEMTVPISAMFVADSEEDDGETFPLADVIDLEPALRDDVLLSLPILPTCPEECEAQLVGSAENGLNTPAPADESSADGIPEDLSDEGSPFSVLRDLLEPGD